MSLLDDRRGGVTVIAAISLTALIAASALAVDLGSLYAERATLQQVGDSAAYAGAMAYAETSSSAAMMATIQDIVQANGWSTTVVQTAGTGYLAQSPQGSGAAVQVTLSTVMPTHLINAVSKITGLSVRTYSLANLTGTGAPACVLSLSTVQVNSAIDLNGCSMLADSTGSSAINVNGGGAITANIVATPGGITDNGTINATQKTGAAAVSDPFSSYQSQASQGFTNCQNVSNYSQTLQPGCYSNVNVNSGQTLTLASGTFFFTGLNVNSGGSLVATSTGGSTIVAENQFSPSGSISVSAPTTGSWDGMAIYAMGGINMNANVPFAIDGAIYSPTAAIIEDSGAWNENDCTELVGQSITFNSSAKFTLPQSNCSALNYPTASTSGGATNVALQQ